MKIQIAAFALLSVAATPALAGDPFTATQQDLQGSAFARDRNTAVTDRYHPEYAPLDLRWENLIIRPTLEIGPVFTDNVFAVDQDKKSDVDLRMVPEIALVSDWSRNQLLASVRGTYDKFFKYNSESSPQVDVTAQYRLDTTKNSSLTVSGEYADETEPRESTTYDTGLQKPLRYQLAQGTVIDVNEFNRFRLTLTGNAQDYQYAADKFDNGSPVDVGSFNRDLLMGTAQLDYAINPGTSVYVYAGANEHGYQHTEDGQSRNSHGFDTAIGSSFDITRLVRGDIRVGYLRQYYDANIASAGGLSLKASVQYFPTQLTTVKFTGERSVEDTDAPSSSSFVAEIGTVRIDHELFRNIILFGEANREHDVYNGICSTPGCVFGRNDDLWTATLGATYQWSRRIGLTFDYKYENLDSNGPNRAASYSSNIVQLTTTLRY